MNKKISRKTPGVLGNYSEFWIFIYSCRITFWESNICGGSVCFMVISVNNIFLCNNHKIILETEFLRHMSFHKFVKPYT